MININHLCMQCMKEHGGADVCPHCGYREDGLQTAPYLPVKTWLMDRYLVGKMTTCDGEGVTYIGWDNVLQSAVLIREFLPGGLCQRVGAETVRPIAENAADYSRCLAAFLDLCRALARMRDLSALFPVYDIFELNGTAYAVSEYTESITLREFLHRNGDALTFEQARTLLMPTVSTLASLHAADLIHGGISPETLYVGKDGKVRLSGFAGRDLRIARGSLRRGRYPGYAAIEQYGFDGKIGPHTDVYAFAGVFYRVVSGQDPADAKTRMTQDSVIPAVALGGKAPPYAVDALASALQLMPDNRTATVERFRAELSAAPTVTKDRVSAQVSAPVEPTRSAAPAKAKKKDSKTALYVVIAMLVTLLVLGGLLLVLEAQFGFIGLFEKDDSTPVSVLQTPSQDNSVPSAPVSVPEGPTDEIPDLIGRNLAACQKDYPSYEFVEQYKVYDSNYAKGAIVSQSPAAGEQIPVGEDAPTITVIVNMGSDKVTPPENVAGMTYGDALVALLDAGYLWDSIETNIGEVPSFDYVVTKAQFSGTSVYKASVMLHVEPPKETEKDPADQAIEQVESELEGGMVLP